MLKDSIVIAYLKDPKERIWGILRSMDASGLFMEGINIESFEEWIQEYSKTDYSGTGLSKVFFPASRIERILIDEPAGKIPSLSQRFEEKTGKTISELFKIAKMG